MPCFAFDGIKPVVDKTTFIHPSAVIIGDVWIAGHCYIGPFACLRGDFSRIIVDSGSNIQEAASLHGYPNQDILLEENSHVGHGAIIHTATVRKNALIGMQALLMDYAEVGESAIVAAQSFVPIRYKVPAKTLVAGTPCRVIRDLTPAEILAKTAGTELYHQLTKRAESTCKRVHPLRPEEADSARQEQRSDWHFAYGPALSDYLPDKLPDK